MGSKKIDTGSIQRRMEKSSKISKQAEDIEKSEVIPVADIDFNKENFFNKFDTDEDIDKLVESIKENGLIHPINVMKNGDRYLLISGERRLRAYIKMGKPGIRATIVSNLTELEILKRTFYGNADVRNYTLEQKLSIISMYKSKLDELSETGDYDVAAFKKDISEAFKINSRQTDRLISINDGLIPSLTMLMCADKIDINSGARYSMLPADCQEFIYNFFNDDVINDPKKMSVLKKELNDFVTRAKTIISKKNTSERNCLTTISYNKNNIDNYQNELKTIEAEIVEAQKSKPALLPALEEKKAKIEKNIAKSKSQLSSANSELAIFENSASADIEALKKSYDAIITHKLNDFDTAESDSDIPADHEREKKIRKEIKAIESSVRKLKELLPSEELTQILSIMEKYKINKL